MTARPSRGLRDLALAGGMRWVDLRCRRRWLRAARDPAAAQAALLRRILQDNADTAFGRRHGFAALRGLEHYRRAVPVHGYEDLRRDIDAQADTGQPVLSRDPVIGYARTSGTTGEPKDIPVTAATLAQNREAQRLTALSLYRATSFFAGQVVVFASPAAEGRRACGAPYGSASGQAYSSLSAVIRDRFVLPPALYAVEDHEAKYYLAALLALAAPRVTGFVAANPSTLLRLADVVGRHRGQLARDLAAGATDRAGGLDPALQAAVGRALAASRPACERLGRALGGDGPILLRDLWPEAGAVLTWTGGSCGVAVDALGRQLPQGCRIVELGYRASELIGTVNLDAAGNRCLPALLGAVFEFVEADAWERGGGRFLTLGELQEEQDYYVIVTTAAGLYRYDMNDIVRVTGRVGATPTLAFVRKGRGVTSITGEKLAEQDVIAVVGATLSGLGLVSPFYVALADAAAARYDLLVEIGGDAPPGLSTAIAAAVDDGLSRRNLEYGAKRASGRLKPVQAILLAGGAGELVRREAIRLGQREAQYKPTCLAAKPDWPTDLMPLAREVA